MNRFFNIHLLLVVVIAGFSGLSAPACHAQDSQESDSGDVVKERLGKYVGKLIKLYDKNGDGILQEDEISQMRRKPDKGVDANEDGSITKDEMIEHFKERITRSGGSSSERRSRKKDSDDKDAEKAQPSSSEALTIDVFMLRAEDDSPLEKLATNLRGESAENVEEMLRAVRRDEDLDCDYDTMQFTVNWNQKFRLTVGAEKPVVVGVSSRRGGETSQSVTSYSVGTTLSVLASNESNQTLYIDLNKASVFDSNTVLHKSESGDEIKAKNVANLEFTSEFAFEKNKANVASMSDSGSTWVLVFVVR